MLPGRYVDATTITFLGQHRLVVAIVAAAEVVYEHGPGGWWGTFLKTTAQPRRWYAHVVFYGRRCRLAAVDVRFAHAGERIVVAP